MIYHINNEREREIQASIQIIYIEMKYLTFTNSLYVLLTIDLKQEDVLFLFIYSFICLYLSISLSTYLNIYFYLRLSLSLHLSHYLSITFFASLHFTLSIILIFLVVLAARIKSKLSFTSSSGSRSQRINLQK